VPVRFFVNIFIPDSVKRPICGAIIGAALL
jgi:hypothetical protein